MGYYNTAQICLNGHKISANASSDTHQEYCSKCGAKTITSCPTCSSPIRGFYNVDGVISIGRKYTIPAYCHNCGKPYPWTKSAIEATALLIQEDAELSELERKSLESSLPDIISETPKTKVASIRIKKALLTAGEFTADALRQFVIDFGCELAKKSLGL